MLFCSKLQKEKKWTNARAQQPETPHQLLDTEPIPSEMPSRRNCLCRELYESNLQ